MEDSQEYNRYKRKMVTINDESGVAYHYEASKASKIYIMSFTDRTKQYYVVHETDKNNVVGVYDYIEEAVEKFQEVIKKETYHIVYDMFLLLDKDDVGYIFSSQIKFMDEGNEIRKERLTFEEFQDFLVQNKLNFKELRNKIFDDCHPKIKKRISSKIYKRISNYRQSRIKEICSSDDKKTEHSKNYINAFIQIFEQGAELADIISDVVLALTIYKGGITALDPKPYLILTVIFFVATLTPYVLAYSSGIQLMIKKGILNEDSYKRLGAKKKFMIGTVLTVFGPLFYIFLHLFDVFVDLCEGLSTLFLSEKNYSIIMRTVKGFQYSLGLNQMEYEGFLLQRKISQLMFESLSSFILNILILSTPLFGIEDIIQNSKTTIYISLATTIWNIAFQIFLLNLQAKYFQEGFLNYCLICMKARFGWIPFIDAIEKNQLKKNIDYANLRFTVPFFSRLFGIYLHINCEFGDVDIRNMKNAFESIKITSGFTDSATPQYIHEIKMGKVLENVSIDAIAQLLVSVPKELNFSINLNGISWRNCIKNKMKSTASGKLVENWEPVLPTGEHLLKVCIDSENEKGQIFYHEMFVAILEEKANPNSFDLFGESLLYYAAKTKKENSLKLLLKYEADPSIPNKFREETPIIPAVSNNDYQLIEILLEANADLHKLYTNKENVMLTPFMLAFSKWNSSKATRDDELLKFLKKKNIMAKIQEEKDMIFSFINKCDDGEYLKIALQFIPKAEMERIKDKNGNNLLHCFFSCLTDIFNSPFEIFSSYELKNLGSQQNKDGDEPGIVALKFQNSADKIQKALSICYIEQENEKFAEIVYQKLDFAIGDITF